jgi:hypothetical protein
MLVMPSITSVGADTDTGYWILGYTVQLETPDAAFS